MGWGRTGCCAFLGRGGYLRGGGSAFVGGWALKGLLYIIMYSSAVAVQGGVVAVQGGVVAVQGGAVAVQGGAVAV